MSLGNNLKKRVTGLAKDVAKASSDAVDFAKYKLQLTDVRDEINTRYTEVGRMVVEQGSDVDSAEMGRLVQEIEQLKQRMDEINEELAALKKTAICESCGKEIRADAQFCQFCGAKTGKE